MPLNGARIIGVAELRVRRRRAGLARRRPALPPRSRCCARRRGRAPRAHRPRPASPCARPRAAPQPAGSPPSAPPTRPTDAHPRACASRCAPSSAPSRPACAFFDVDLEHRAAELGADRGFTRRPQLAGDDRTDDDRAAMRPRRRSPRRSARRATRARRLLAFDFCCSCTTAATMSGQAANSDQPADHRVLIARYLVPVAVLNCADAFLNCPPFCGAGCAGIGARRRLLRDGRAAARRNGISKRQFRQQRDTRARHLQVPRGQRAIGFGLLEQHPRIGQLELRRDAGADSGRRRSRTRDSPAGRSRRWIPTRRARKQLGPRRARVERGELLDLASAAGATVRAPRAPPARHPSAGRRSASGTLMLTPTVQFARLKVGAATFSG